MPGLAVLAAGLVAAALALAVTSLSSDPASHDFGSRDVNDGPTSQLFTITNNGGSSASIDTVSTGTADFIVNLQPGDCVPGTTVLATNASCTVHADFDPSTTGSKSDTLTIGSNAGPLPIPLSGTGAVTTLTPSEASFDFGGQDIDDGPVVPDRTFTFTNSGPRTLDIATVAVSSGQGFSRNGGTCQAGMTSLASGASCTVVVSFDPSTTGDKTGTVTVTPTAGQAAPATVDLMGKGEQTTLSPSPSSFYFGARDIDDGPVVPDKTFTFTNSGPKTLDIATVSVSSGEGFSRNGGTCDAGMTSLAPNASCTVIVRFDPSTTGGHTGSVTVTPPTGQAAPASASLSGDGEQTTISPDQGTLAFGARDIDDGPVTPDQTATFTNSGPKTVAISGVSVSSGQGFTRNGGTCDPGTTSLGPGTSCTVTVRFDPSSIGGKTGTLTVTSPDAFDAVVNLTGTGEQTTLSPSPSSFDFGGQDIDDGPVVPDKTFTFTNSGPKTLDIQTVSVSSGQGFSRNGGTCDAGTTTLAPNGSCTVIVSFDPSTTGDKTGTVTVTPPATQADPATADLMGKGEQTTISPDQGTLAFGARDIDDGPVTPDQTATFTNSGPKTVAISGVSVSSGQGFTRNGGTCTAGTTSLAPNASCTVTVRFDPSTIGGKTGTLTVTSPDAFDAVVNLTGTGEQTTLSPSPSSFDFGGQDIDDGPVVPDKTFTFTNSGPKTLDIQTVSVSSGQGFTRSGGTCDAGTTSLTPSTSCTVIVRFDPSAIGGKSGTVTVTPPASQADPATASLSGTGEQTTISPNNATLDFGSQDVNAGPSSTQTSTIANSGPKTVALNKVAIEGDQRAQFIRLTDNPGTDCSNTTSLGPGATCEVRVRFDPSYDGPKSATVAITTPDADPVNIALVGNADQAVFGRSDAPLDSYEFDGAVNAVAFDSAGRTYVGGAFTQIGLRTGRGVKLTDANDQPAAGFPDVDGPINAVASDGSGGWFIGGSFSTVGGVARTNLAHILSSGALDTGWNPQPDNTVNALVRSGSNLFVGGDFIQIAGQSNPRLAKLSVSTGALGVHWAPNPNSTVTAITVSGASVYVGGNFGQIAGVGRTRLAKLDVTLGEADESWDAGNVNNVVNAIAVDGTGVYVGGSFTKIGTTTRNRIAKLALADGALNSNWNPNASGAVNALTLDGSTLYVGGAFTSIDGQLRNRIARLSTVDPPDPANPGDPFDPVVDGWDPNANSTVNSIEVSPAGIYVAGAFATIGGQPRNRIARLSPTTALADTWNPNANGTANDIAIDGTDLYVGGAFTSVGGQIARARLARLLPDGTIDPDWNPSAGGTVNALVVSGSDVYVGGAFQTIGTPPTGRNRLALLTTATGAPVNATWNPDADSTVNSLALSGGDLFVGGLFTHVSSLTHNRIAKVSASPTGTGSVVDAWQASASGSVLALATDGTSVYAGGSFTTVNVTGPPTGNRHFLAKLSASGAGTLDPDWNPSADSTVRALLLSGTSLFAGGDFASIGGVTRGRLAKLSATGAPGDTGVADLAWDPSANNVVRALAIAGQDIYAGGDFTQVGGVSHNNVVRLPTGDGGAHDSGWNPIANGSVNALATTATRLAAGGAFTTVHSQSRQGVALFNLPRLSRDPGGHQFGLRDTAGGATSARTSTVMNTGTVPLALSAVTLGGADAGDFQRLTGNMSDCSDTTTLPPGGTCDVRVQFDPSTTGVKSAWVEIDAPNTPEATIGLAGTGTHTEIGVAPTTLQFDDLDIDDGPAPGPSQDLQSVVTNNGSQSITIDALTDFPTGSDFTRLTGEPTDCFASRQLLAGQSCNVRVEFNPVSTGTKNATVVVDSSGGQVSIGLQGRGTQTTLSNSKSTFAFGKQDIDDPATTDESTVANTGSEPLHISAENLTGAAFSFASGNTCTAGVTLTAGQTCKVRVSFTPGTVGMKSGSVTVDLAELPDVNIALSGEGTDTRIETSPSTLAFGKHDIDNNGKELATVVTNTGTETVHLNVPTVSGADFAFATTTGSNDCDANTVLAAHDTCNLRIAFDPTTVGMKSGSVTVTSDELPDLVTNLSGEGTQTQLTATPDPLDFQKQDIDEGTKGPLTSVVKNTGTETVHFDAAPSVTGSGFAFATPAASGDCDASTVLAKDETCNLRLTFTPGTVGHKTGAVKLDTTELPEQNVALQGDGTDTRLEATPAALAFGGQDIDENATAPKTTAIKNTGTEDVIVTGKSITGTNSGDFHFEDPATGDCGSNTLLHAGDSCNVRINFDPAAMGDRAADLHVTSNLLPDVVVGLTGKGTQVAISRTPSSLDFGKQDVDEDATAPKTVVIKNTGTENVTVDTVGVAGTGFALVSPTTSSDCTNGKILAANETCDARVTFDPASVGNKTGTLTVTAEGVTVTADLAGEGTQTAWSRSPATVDLGSQDVDENATADGFATISNSGTESIAITGVALSGAQADQFELHGGTCGASVAGGASCTVGVRFDPSSRGVKSATVTVSTNNLRVTNLTFDVTGKGIDTAWSRDKATLSFGSKDIDDNATVTQDVTVSNDGTEAIAVSGVSSNNGQFQLDTGPGTDCSEISSLAAGASCHVLVKFDPSSVGSKSGTITISTTTSGISNLTVAVSGTGIQTELSRSPASRSFGNKDIDDGPTPSLQAVVTNSGTEDVTISGVDVPANFAQVTDAGSDCVSGTVLNAGATCDLRITFDPSSTGAKSGNVTVHSNAADVSVAVDGTGTQTELTRSPGSLSFGNKDIDEGPTAAKDATVTNSGTEPVTIAAMALPEHFQQVSGSGTNCAGGTVLTAGQLCKVYITFDPTTTGAKSGNVTVHSNAADVSVAVDGTGIQTELSRSPDNLAFGSRDIDNGPTAAQEATVTNTGTQDVHLTNVSIGGGDPSHYNRLAGQGTDCTGSTTLAAGQTCKVRIEFDPSTTGSKSATLTIHSTEVPDLTVSLSGFGAQTELSRSPASLAFGSKGVGAQTAAKAVTVTNTGTEDVPVTSVSIDGGDSPNFVRLTGQSTDCASSTTLHAGDNCKVRVRFAPTSAGAKSATLTVHSSAVPDLTAALSGTGLATDLSPSPTTLAFGARDIDDGATATQDSTVTNSSGEDVTLSAVTLGGPGAEHFQLGSGTCAAGQVLHAGDSCSVRASFDPTSTGAKAASITITSDSAPVSVALTGTGTQTLLAAAPTALSLGSQDVDEGPTSAQTATITNVGSEPVTLSGVAVTGEFAQATGNGDDCGPSTVLAAGQTCNLRITFDPSSVGGKTGTATVSSNAADVSIPLDAAGIQTEITRNPDALGFGSRNVSAGATRAQVLTLTNSGTQPVSLTAVGITGRNAGQFQRLSGAADDCGPGTALAADATCKVRVRFRPTSAGAKAAGVTVASSAGGDLVTPLSGTGLPRPKLKIPAFHATAASTAHRRLKVPVVPVGGTIRKIVVEVRSRSGKLLGTGKLSMASAKATVSVKLTKPLPAGRYVAKARGTDAFRHRTATASRSFPLTAPRPKRNPGSGGGQRGGQSGGATG